MITLAAPLPTAIEYGGKKYKLCPAFDNILTMLQAIDGLDDISAVDVSLHFLIDGSYPLNPGLQKACFELLTPPQHTFGDNNLKSFDFVQDAPYIYASFRQAYGINLFNEQGKMHWWEFLSLLTGLPENTKFCEVVSIRQRPLPNSNKHNAEERANLIKLKRAYALVYTEEEKKQNLENGFSKLALCLLGMAKGSDING